MSKRTVSITLANFNHGHFLRRSLSAITAQSRSPDEVILVDDASTDDSVSVMEEFASRYEYVRIVRNEMNIGVIASANKALQVATGDYIHWAAADDYMLPGFVEQLMAAIEAVEDAGIASSALASVPDHSDDGWGMDGVPLLNPAASILSLPECRSGFYTSAMYRDFLDETSVSPMETLAPSTFFNALLLKEMGGWPLDLGMHGVSFVLRVCGLRLGMAYVDVPLYTWIWRQKSITQKELLDTTHLQNILDHHQKRMNEEPFSQLFTDAFKKRWEVTSRELLHPPKLTRHSSPPRSLLQRAFERILGLKKP